MPNDQPNGWPEYKKLVMAELERINEQLGGMNKRLNRIEVEIGMLKVKAGVWGVAGGLIPASIAIAVSVLG